MSLPQDGSHEPIAIVGMGCRWPGNVRDTSEFWKYLHDKVDGWRELGLPRYSTAGFYHPDSSRQGSMGMKGAFLVEEDARLFDHTFFGMTALEAETLDPSQRKLLEVVYEAIENAGDTWDSVSGSRTGVFVGNFCLDHWMIQSRDWDYPRPYAFTGAGTSILANRVSYIFNLRGPSLTVDTACSSSMYALHLAMNALRAGDCDSAIVASANWIADPGVQIALDKLGALSASSRCHTFDQRAEGYARGEGYGAIYLKKLPLAVAHESPIRAVIRGTAVNSNGRTGGITRPSASGQELVIREAYRNAGGLPYASTSYFECHGTGTYVGDPIEVAAIGKVFAPERKAENPLLVGSVKNNVGHGEGASALASIMKVVLALEKGLIPPIYDLQTRNPNIDFDGAKIIPVTEVTPWPGDRLQRASINSFGYGGANGHCIIDHVNIVLPGYVSPGIYDGGLRLANGPSDCFHKGSNNKFGSCSSYCSSKRLSNDLNNGLSSGHAHVSHNQKVSTHRPIVGITKTVGIPNASTRQWVILPFSAHNEVSYKTNLEALGKVCHNLSLADVAYTVGTRRSKLAQRSFSIVERGNIESGFTMDHKLVRAPLQTASLGFVFTGQGAQWHGMAAELFEYQVFRSTIEYLDYVLSTLPNAPSWSLYTILTCEVKDAALVQKAEISQTLCTAVQVGLVDLLASWSIRPSGVVGHSSGEIAAAYAAGRITAAEAIVAAYLRGQAVSRNKRKGAMLAAGLSSDHVLKYLMGREEEVKVAAINSPGSVTLSGEPATIDEISTLMTADSVFNRILKTGDNAYHSHHMASIGSKYVDMLDEGFEHIEKLGLVDGEYRYQHILWVSSVVPEKSTDEFLDPASYWRANLQSPVRFSEALARLMNNEDAAITALVEIGPHPALKTPVEQILRADNKTAAYASTLKRQEDGRISMLQCAGTLFTLNASVDFAVVNAMDATEVLQRGCICHELPPYRYTYGDLNYYESRPSKEYRYRPILRHDLLGSKLVGTAKLRPQWRNILRLKDVPWLADHMLVPDTVFPGAAYVAMAVEASLRTYNEFPSPHTVKGFSLKDVAIKQTLVIPDDDYGVEVMTSLELVDIATASKPLWTTFSISSVGGESGEWTEHSTGRVKIELDASLASTEQFQSISNDTQSIESTPLPVDSKAWYKKFLDIGLGYGPVFQPLSNIYTDQYSKVALATVDLHPNGTESNESRYAIHPASLDGAIQLGLVACNGGQTNEAHTAFVPVKIANLYISANIVQDFCTVVARGQKRGLRGAHLDLQMLGSEGELLLHAESLRCISYMHETKPVDLTFSSPFSRLVWKPDIRLMTNQQARQLYLPPQENIAKVPLWRVTNKVAHFVVLSMYEKLKKIQDVPRPSGDTGHFFEWVKRKGQNDHSELMEEARSLASQGILLQELDSLANQAPDVFEVKIAKLLHDNVEDILYERRTGIEVIIAEELLTPLYQSGLLMTGIYPQLSQVLSGIAHSNPNLRILEIGGGTGGGTRIAMKAFTHPNGMKAYSDYTFTDISAGFLSGARESLAELRDMTFSVFDVEVDPAEQGYEQAYDLVLACQVLHATSNMHRCLSNCRKLLRPGGKLVIVETTQNFIVPGVVVGTFTGYWAGIPDGRVDAPFQSLPAWNEALQKAGFSGLDLVLDDLPEPHNTTSVIVSTVLLEETAISQEATVYVHYGGLKSPAIIECICQELGKRDVNVRQVSSFDGIDHESRVIALYDDEHLMIDVSEKELEAFRNLTSTASNLVLVTSCGTVKGRNADSAVVSGLLRVLQNENPAKQYASIDVDAANFDLETTEILELARAIVDIEFGLQQNTTTDDTGNPRDYEFSWQDGSIWVSRHVPDTGFHSQHGLDFRRIKPELLPLSSQGDLQAAFETAGVLNSLYFTTSNDLLQPLPKDHIDVKVRAWALNDKDLDNWTGRADGDHLSSEYAGIITAVGSGVDGLQVGDYVYGVGKGQFGTSARVPAAFASKLQSCDDPVQMASLPLAYTTAIYALDHVAHIQKGQSVLVHAGASDVGIATITLAKAKGADIFAMTDTSEQASFLIDQRILPASHVIAGLNLNHLHQIAKTTRKGKFEIYISTSPKSETLSKVLAPRGYIIDVSGRGAFDSPRDLAHKATYTSVDMLDIFETDPVLGAELVQSADDYRRQGVAVPIPSLSMVDIGAFSPVSLDFNSLSGKLVVDFGNSQSVVRQAPSPPKAVFESEACYVIAGGLGGLGQAIVHWMADRGARHFALLSRRQASDVPGAEKFLSSFASRDIEVQCLTCDISDKEQVFSVIRHIAAARPIRGVVHAAVSYLDLTFDKVSASRWQAGLSAKVQGTKNIHEATLSMPLDFFVMTTSALSVYAFATQGAYTAANNFQDAFARYRQNMGLPASTISFSLVEEITHVGTDAITVDLFERNKTLILDQHQFLTLLEPAFLNNRTTTQHELVSWTGQVEDPFSSANLHTYLDPQALVDRQREASESSAPHSSVTPRWYNDGRISHMMRAFYDAQKEFSQLQGSEGPKNTTAQLRAEFDTAIEKGSDGRTSAVTLAQDSIIGAVASMLYVDVADIDPAKSVANLGVDSLIAAELRSWFLQALGANISMLDLLDPAASIISRAANIVDAALEATKA